MRSFRLSPIALILIVVGSGLAVLGFLLTLPACPGGHDGITIANGICYYPFIGLGIPLDLSAVVVLAVGIRFMIHGRHSV